MVGASTGIDEDADGDGDVALGDEVVEDGGVADLAVGVSVAEAVLEDEKGGGFGGVVLGGNVNEVFAVGVGEDLAVIPGVAGDGAFGDVLREGVGVGRIRSEWSLFREPCRRRRGWTNGFRGSSGSRGRIFLG